VVLTAAHVMPKLRSAELYLSKPVPLNSLCLGTGTTLLPSIRIHYEPFLNIH
jgi:hypothetical protein